MRGPLAGAQRPFSQVCVSSHAAQDRDLATASCPLEGVFWATVGLRASLGPQGPRKRGCSPPGRGLWDLGCANRSCGANTQALSPNPSPEPEQQQLSPRLSLYWPEEQRRGLNTHQADGNTLAQRLGPPRRGAEHSACSQSSPAHGDFLDLLGCLETTSWHLSGSV